MLSYLALELCIDAALLGRSIADQQVHNSEILYEIVECLVTVPLFLDRVRSSKEIIVGKYLTIFLVVDGRAPHVHGIGCPSPL